MHDLNDFRLFVYVVDEKGFAAAARRLGVPRSQVSRRVQMLEDDLGLRLVQRTPHSFTVTEIGREFYLHCRAMLIEAEAASEVILRQSAEPQGVIRVACPSSMIHFQLAPMVADFMALYPKVTVLLESTNRRVDVLREGFDLAVRVRFPPLEDSELIVRQFGSDRQHLVCAPDCLGGARPQTPADLNAYPSLSWNPDQTAHAWDLIGPNGEETRLPHHPRLLTQDMAALLSATRKGIGICQLPGAVVAPLLADGSLIEALPGWSPRSGIIHAVFPTRRGMLPAIRAFLDHLAQKFG